MSKATTKFVYTTYISTTPEEIWAAITKPEIARQYWAHENVSDWKPGSNWEHVRSDASRRVVLAGSVIESVQPKKLVITWADAPDFADKAKHTRVTFELEPIGDMVRLTVTHDELKEDSEMLRKITNGWPRVLSSMKSFLETGKPLDTWGAAEGLVGASTGKGA
jgi:uncharacterized protein YndB with AHSA1/START domain